MEPLTVDLAEAARLLSISPHTVRSYIKKGHLPAVRCCRRVLIEVEALRHWIEENRDKTPLSRNPGGAER